MVLFFGVSIKGEGASPGDDSIIPYNSLISSEYDIEVNEENKWEVMKTEMKKIVNLVARAYIGTYEKVVVTLTLMDLEDKGVGRVVEKSELVLTEKGILRMSLESNSEQWEKLVKELADAIALVFNFSTAALADGLLRLLSDEGDEGIV